MSKKKILILIGSILLIGAIILFIVCVSIFSSIYAKYFALYFPYGELTDNSDVYLYEKMIDDITWNGGAICASLMFLSFPLGITGLVLLIIGAVKKEKPKQVQDNIIDVTSSVRPINPSFNENNDENVMNFCPRCGNRLNSNDAFCGRCGYKIKR